MLFIRCPKLLNNNGGAIVKIRINAKNVGGYIHVILLISFSCVFLCISQFSFRLV